VPRLCGQRTGKTDKMYAAIDGLNASMIKQKQIGIRIIRMDSLSHDYMHEYNMYKHVEALLAKCKQTT